MPSRMSRDNRPPSSPSPSLVTGSRRATGRPRSTIRTGAPLLRPSMRALRRFLASVMLAFSSGQNGCIYRAIQVSFAAMLTHWFTCQRLFGSLPHPLRYFALAQTGVSRTGGSARQIVRRWRRHLGTHAGGARYMECRTQRGRSMRSSIWMAVGPPRRSAYLADASHTDFYSPHKPVREPCSPYHDEVSN
jgi:hypothetical protein